MTGQADDELVGLLEEGLRARVIEETDRPAAYRFTHALMQETLLAEISTARRLRLHGQVGEALQRRWGDDPEHASVLAAHFVESAYVTPAHREQALHYSRIAASVAERQSAWSEAATHYANALSALPELRDVREEAVLQRGLGNAQMNAGDHDAAWSALTRAASLFRADGDVETAARVVLDACYSWNTDPLEKRALVRGVLDELKGGDNELEAGLLATYLNRSATGGIPQDEAQVARRRLEELTRDTAGGARDILAYAELSEKFYTFRSNSPEDIMAAAAAFEATHRYHNATLMLSNAAHEMALRGDLDAARAAYEAASLAARQRGITLVEEVTRLGVADVLLARAEFVGVDQLAEMPATTREASVKRAVVLANRAEVAGDVAQALAFVEGVHALSHDPDLRPLAHLTWVRLLANAGRSEAAAIERKNALGYLGARGIGTRFGSVTLDPNVGALDEALTSPPDPELIHAAVMLAEYLDEAPESHMGIEYSTRCRQRVLASAELASGLLDRAEARYQRALAWCERERCPIEAGRCLQGLADIAEQRGDEAAAMEYLDRAGTLFSQYGAKLYLDRVLSKKQILKA